MAQFGFPVVRSKSLSTEASGMSETGRCVNFPCNHCASGESDGLCVECRRGEVPGTQGRLAQDRAWAAEQDENREVARWKKKLDLTNCIMCGHTMAGCDGWRDGNPLGGSLMSCDSDEIREICAERVPCGYGVEDRMRYLCHLCGAVDLDAQTMKAWKQKHGGDH